MEREIGLSLGEQRRGERGNGHLPALKSEEENYMDSAIALTCGISGFFGDHMKLAEKHGLGGLGCHLVNKEGERIWIHGGLLPAPPEIRMMQIVP